MIFIGEKGILMHETYGNNPRIYPEALMEKAAGGAEDAAAHHRVARAQLGDGDARARRRRARRSSTPRS